MKQSTPYYDYAIYAIVSLIRKAKRGNLTEEELLTLHKWIDQHPRNRELYNRLLSTDQTEQIERMLTKDTLGRYAQIIGQARAKKMRRWATYTGMAAAAAITVYFLFVPSVPENPIKLDKQTALVGKMDKSDMITLQTGGVHEDLFVREDSVYEMSAFLRDVHTEEPDADGLERVVIRTPIGKTIAFKMYDGSTVYLNSNSQLSFYNQDDFLGERRVQLDGEAFFEVTKDEKKPFVVENNGNEIKVLGTSFNVNGYDSRATFRLGLASGKVEVNIKDAGVSKVLTPGYELAYDKKNQKVTQNTKDVHRMGLWRTGIYVFEGIPISELTKDMEQIYPIRFKYEGEMPKHLFNGEISRNDSWQKVLNKLEMTNRVRFTIEGNEVTVRGHDEYNVEK